VQTKSLVTACVLALTLGLTMGLTVHTAPPVHAADVNCPTASDSLSGTGTSGYPYLVQSQADLQLMKTAIPSGSAYYEQTTDISMQVGGSDCVWDQGINYGFSGQYDGGGFVISGLQVNSALSPVGLFPYVAGTGEGAIAIIKNVGFTGSVTSSSTADNVYVGGLVGWFRGGTIENSYTTGNVESQSTYSGSASGGLVGNARDGASITGSHATGDVTSPKLSGGLVGLTSASAPNVTISESYSTGNVAATAALGNAGGLVGNLTNVTVTKSYATGDVSGVANVQHLGGLFASMTNSTVTDAFATGGVSGWTTSSSTYGQVGGLVGDGTGSGNTLTRTYSATISGMTPGSGTAVDKVGGVAGVVASTTWDSVVWNSETALPLVVKPIGGTTSVTGVTSYTTSEMTDISTYTDSTGLNWNSGGAQTIATSYDVSYTWGICSAVNNGYPFLTATYSSDPCSSPTPTPAGNASSGTRWPVFTFQVPGGWECIAISPQYPDLNSWFTLPDEDAPCFELGSVLTGWSIPGQDWAFAPGRRVRVVDSQVFTSVLEYEWVRIEYDSNIHAQDVCLAAGENLLVPDRTGITHIPRSVITDQPLWSSPVCSAPGYEFMGWTTDNPHHDPTILPKDGTMPAPSVNADGDAANTIHLYATWKYVG